MTDDTVHTLVRLLAERQHTPAPLPIPSAWSPERRFIEDNHLVIERHAGVAATLRITSDAWVLTVHLGDRDRVVARHGFGSVKAARESAYAGVGL